MKLNAVRKPVLYAFLVFMLIALLGAIVLGISRPEGDSSETTRFLMDFFKLGFGAMIGFLFRPHESK